MQEKILRLQPIERQTRIKLLDFEINNDDLFINIFREEYSKELRGYFMRSKSGTAIVVNSSLSSVLQAQVIKEIVKGLKRCPSSELGLVKENMKFICGGHCCFEK